eukprot:gene12752-biopygen9937
MAPAAAWNRGPRRLRRWGGKLWQLRRWDARLGLERGTGGRGGQILRHSGVPARSWRPRCADHRSAHFAEAHGGDGRDVQCGEGVLRPPLSAESPSSVESPLHVESPLDVESPLNVESPNWKSKSKKSMGISRPGRRGAPAGGASVSWRRGVRWPAGAALAPPLPLSWRNA